MVGRVGLLRHHGTHSGEDVTKSATKALQGGISDGKKPGISTIHCAPSDEIRAFVADSDNRATGVGLAWEGGGAGTDSAQFCGADGLCPGGRWSCRRVRMFVPRLRRTPVVRALDGRGFPNCLPRREGLTPCSGAGRRRAPELTRLCP